MVTWLKIIGLGPTDVQSSSNKIGGQWYICRQLILIKVKQSPILFFSLFYFFIEECQMVFSTESKFCIHYGKCISSEKNSGKRLNDWPMRFFDPYCTFLFTRLSGFSVSKVGEKQVGYACVSHQSFKQTSQ